MTRTDPAWRPPLIIGTIVLVLNVIYAIWHYFSIMSTLSPGSYPALSKSSAQTGFLVMLFFYGFALTIVNGTAAFACAALIFGALGKITPKSDRFWVVKAGWILLAAMSSIVLIGAGLVFTGAPFISPFFASNLAWKFHFRDACEGMNTRIWLDSRSYQPAKSVWFEDLPSGKHFSMFMQPDAMESHETYNAFTLDPGFGPSEGPEFGPRFKSVEYNLTARNYHTTGGARQLNGSFALGELWRVEVPRVEQRKGEVELGGDLSNYESSCLYDGFVEIWNGEELWARTVRFTHCGSLQVCSKGDVEESVVLTGLLVLERAMRGMCCQDDD